MGRNIQDVWDYATESTAARIEVMQNRPPPAYQEYAASILCDNRFKRLSYGERGFLWTIRLECWINGSVDADLTELSRLFGPESPSLLHGIKSWLKVTHGRITCPELDDYKSFLLKRNSKKSMAGKASGVARKKRTDVEQMLNRCSDSVEQEMNILRLDKSRSDKSRSAIDIQSSNLLCGENADDGVSSIFQGGTT